MLRNCATEAEFFLANSVSLRVPQGGIPMNRDLHFVFI